ncbi:MAG: hypothetical protein U1E52_15050 [Geminicoccaceae bacterium]
MRVHVARDFRIHGLWIAQELVALVVVDVFDAQASPSRLIQLTI